MEKLTHDVFIDRISKINPNIDILSEYNGMSKMVKCHCKVCGFEWETKAENVIRGYGCKQCANKNRAIKIGQSRRKSEEQFRKELKQIHPYLIPNDTYQKATIKYHCICSIHNCDVYKTPHHYLRGQGCVKCTEDRLHRKMRYTHEEYKNIFSNIHPHLELTTPYKSFNEKIGVKCTVCGYQWSPEAGSLIVKNQQYSCPKCAGNIRCTTEQFVDLLKISHPYLLLQSEYINAHTKVDVLCKDCNNVSSVEPSKLKNGWQCSCKHISHGEYNIMLFLRKNNIAYEHTKTFDGLIGVGGGLLSYDFYLPSYNLLIEFQGIQHEMPVAFHRNTKIITQTDIDKFEKQLEHDKRKRIYAEKHHIELLEIWYRDLKKIDSILNSRLLNATQLQNVV